MPWVHTRAIPDYLGLKHPINSAPIMTCDDMWKMIDTTFHLAQNQTVDMSVINILLRLETREWNPFSKQELADALAMCTSNSVPSWDHMSWKFLKFLTSQSDNPKWHAICMNGFLNLFNACFTYGLWPDEFR